MSLAQAGVLVAATAAALYGGLLLRRPPDWRRTVVKAAGAGALAVTARLAEAPPLLALALALCAVGDAALAAGARRTLQGALTAYLLAHVTYGALFLEIGAPARLLHTPWRLAAAAAAALAAAAGLARLWRSLGEMKAAVCACATASAAMVAASLTLGPGFWPVPVGAGLFMASGARLAGRLFRPAPRPHLLAEAGTWWLYAAAQGCVAWAFLRPWTW